MRTSVSVLRALVGILLSLFFIPGISFAAYCVEAIPPAIGSPVFFTGLDPNACNGGVVLTPEEFATITASPTLQDIFSIPLASDLAQLWLVGFSLPLILYLTAWGYGVVVNFFNPDKERY